MTQVDFTVQEIEPDEAQGDWVCTGCASHTEPRMIEIAGEDQGYALFCLGPEGCAESLHRRLGAVLDGEGTPYRGLVEKVLIEDDEPAWTQEDDA